jgi:hypothetical protein
MSHLPVSRLGQDGSRAFSTSRGVLPEWVEFRYWLLSGFGGSGFGSGGC